MGCCSNKKLNPVMRKTDRNQSNIQNRELRIEASAFVNRRSGNIADYYTTIEQMSSSSVGCISLAEHKSSSQRRAIKTIFKSAMASDNSSRARFFSEIDMLRSLDHPNIIKIYEFYEDDTSYHLVTEHMSKESLLENFLNKSGMPEPYVAHILRQVLSALSYCHSKGIIHKDLKPSNLMLEGQGEKPTVKIVAFGTSTFKISENQGSASYIAPEVFTKDFNEKCDIWSCGILCFQMLSGKLPFQGKNDRDIIRRIQKGEFSMKTPKWAEISDRAKRLVNKMLEFNYKTRISASEAVQDEWIMKSVLKNSEGLVKNALENLNKFRADGKFQNAVLTFIASQLLKKEDYFSLAHIFRELDKNSDGLISKDELIEAYSTQLDLKSAETRVDRIMRQVDVNNSGFIDYTEFAMASTEKEVLLSKENLDAAFKAFDSDGSGKISAEELSEILGSEDVSAFLIEFIGEADQNNDGEIDISEFKEMMLKLFDK